MNINKNLMPLIAFFMLLFAKETSYKVNQDIIIQTINEQRPVVIESSNIIVSQTREEIDLWVEDFEEDTSSWVLGSGWNITTSDANSPTHSVNSPNDVTTNNGLWSLVSPTYTLPALGDGETMNFDF